MAALYDVEAVIFDNDGLFVNTQSLWKSAQEHLFAERGRPYGCREESTLLGLSRLDAGAALATLLESPPSEAAFLYERLEALVYEELDRGCDLMPGARALVEA